LNTFALTSLITLLVVLHMFVNALMVGRARQKYEIKAPAVTGNEQFERVYRVQMNTIESVLLFLPALWIYAFYVGDKGAASTGLIWLVGRVWYAQAYSSNPAKRGPGFMIAMLATFGAWFGGLYGAVQVLMH
jgi:glutathione S-transferase